MKITSISLHSRWTTHIRPGIDWINKLQDMGRKGGQYITAISSRFTWFTGLEEEEEQHPTAHENAMLSNKWIQAAIYYFKVQEITVACPTHLFWEEHWLGAHHSYGSPGKRKSPPPRIRDCASSRGHCRFAILVQPCWWTCSPEMGMDGRWTGEQLSREKPFAIIVHRIWPKCNCCISNVMWTECGSPLSSSSWWSSASIHTNRGRGVIIKS